MKITKKYKKIATFLIGCLTMITYSFRDLLYLILKGIRLWKKGYSSCFDEDYQQYTKHIIKYVNNHFNNDKNINTKCFNGLHILHTARRGFKLGCYETQDELINGGIIDNFNTIGLKEKLNYFNYNDKVNLYEKNFFEQKVEKECDFLFCYKSLHLNCNKHIPKERKMKKLLSSVKENALNHKLYPFLQYSNLNY